MSRTSFTAMALELGALQDDGVSVFRAQHADRYYLVMPFRNRRDPDCRTILYYWRSSTKASQAAELASDIRELHAHHQTFIDKWTA